MSARARRRAAERAGESDARGREDARAPAADDLPDAPLRARRDGSHRYGRRPMKRAPSIRVDRGRAYRHVPRVPLGPGDQRPSAPARPSRLSESRPVHRSGDYPDRNGSRSSSEFRGPVAGTDAAAVLGDAGEGPRLAPARVSETDPRCTPTAAAVRGARRRRRDGRPTPDAPASDPASSRARRREHRTCAPSAIEAPPARRTRARPASPPRDSSPRVPPRAYPPART